MLVWEGAAPARGSGDPVSGVRGARGPGGGGGGGDCGGWRAGPAVRSQPWGCNRLGRPGGGLETTLRPGEKVENARVGMQTPSRAALRYAGGWGWRRRPQVGAGNLNRTCQSELARRGTRAVPGRRTRTPSRTGSRRRRARDAGALERTRARRILPQCIP